jgi:hypothetical protein
VAWDSFPQNGILVVTAFRPGVTMSGVHDLPDALADLLDQRAGVLTRSEALQAGMTRKQIQVQVASGRWQRLHLGVYAAFSGEPGRLPVLWAALLRAGPAAVLSHQTAAELNGFLAAPAPLIHVTVPSGCQVAAIPGVRLHYSRRVGEARLPVRVPPRTRIEETVLDLAASARNLDEAFGWVFRACGSRLTAPDRIAAAMALRARMPWRAELSAALGPGAQGVHSLLEYRYVSRVERPHGLPRGRRQRPVTRAGRRQYQDVAYEEYGVLAELDGQAAHPAGERWRDIARDNANAAAGQVTLRYGWADVTGRPCWVAGQVAAALVRRGWAGAPYRCGPDCGLPTRSS